MALSPDTLSSMSTAKLKELRSNYRDQLRNIPKQHSSRNTAVQGDTQRCKNAIDMITRVLKLRTVKRNPLAEFE